MRYIHPPRRKATKEDVLSHPVRDPPDDGKIRYTNAEFLTSFERAVKRVHLEGRMKWLDHYKTHDRFSFYYEFKHHKVSFTHMVPFVAASNAEAKRNITWRFFAGVRFPADECDIPLYAPAMIDPTKVGEMPWDIGKMPWERLLLETISRVPYFQEPLEKIDKLSVGPYRALLFMARFVRGPKALMRGSPKDLDNTTTEKDLTWAWTRFRKMRTRSVLSMVKAFCWRQEICQQNAARALRLQAFFTRKVLEGHVKTLPELLRDV